MQGKVASVGACDEFAEVIQRERRARCEGEADPRAPERTPPRLQLRKISLSCRFAVLRFEVFRKRSRTQVSLAPAREATLPFSAGDENRARGRPLAAERCGSPCRARRGRLPSPEVRISYPHSRSAVR